MKLKVLLAALYRQGVVLERIRHAIPPHHVAGWLIRGDGWYAHVWHLSDLFRPELRWQVLLREQGPAYAGARRIYLQRNVTVDQVVDALRSIEAKEIPNAAI